MAFSYDPNLEDEKQKQEGQGSDPSNQPTSPDAPPTGPSAQSQSASGGGMAPAKPASSGTYVNLQSYLDANKGKNFGEQVAGKVDTDINSARQQTQDASKAFGEQVEQGTTKYDEGLVTGALNDPTKYVANPPASDYELPGSVDQKTGTSTQTPASSGTNTENVSKFQKQLNAQYQGPDSYSQSSDFNRAASAADTAFRRGENTKTEGGRTSLLDEYFSRPTYSSGEKGLDNLLLGADPENQAALAGAAERARALPAEYQDAAGAANALASQGRAATDATRNTTRALTGIDDSGQRLGTGALGTLQSEIDKQYTDAIADRDSRYQAALQGLGSSDSNLKTAQELGASDLTDLYGIDPTKYLSKSETTAGNYTTDDQRAHLAALETLGGLSPEYAYTATRPDSLINFDKAGLGSEVGTSKQVYDSGRSTLESQYQKALSDINALQQVPKFDLGRLAELNARRDDLRNKIASLDTQYGKSNSYEGQQRVLAADYQAAAQRYQNIISQKGYRLNDATQAKAALDRAQAALGALNQKYGQSVAPAPGTVTATPRQNAGQTRGTL